MSASSHGSKTIMVGVVIDDATIGWGTCEEFGDRTFPGGERPLEVQEGAAIIQKLITPFLVGQPLSGLRELSEGLDSIRESAVVKKAVQAVENETAGVSRRAVITGFLSSDETAENHPVETEIVERAIHPAIRQGISQALLSVIAKLRGVSPTEVLLSEYGLPRPSAAVPLQIEIKSGQSLQLEEKVSSLSFTLRGLEAEASLGSDGQHIQRFVRQLKERIGANNPQKQVTIHLKTRGMLGKLYENDPGKILGSLYGLEQAAHPCSIRVEDPLIMADIKEWTKAMVQLMDYVRMRGMSIQLVLGSGITSINDAAALVHAGAAHMLHLVMSQIGSLSEIMNVVQVCRSKGVGVLLEGPLVTTTSHLALAAQPVVLAFSSTNGIGALAHHHNEIDRTLAWLSARE